MESIDASFLELEKIITEVSQYSETIKSEQDTRLKIINRILIEVLGYTLENISTEPNSGTGFIDYLITQKAIGKLVIEAKRENTPFEIDKQYSGRAFNLDGPVFQGKELKDGISQTIYYAAQESVELGCLTNGTTWIIFRANRLGDGKKVKQGKAVIFSTLESVKEEFKLFYELLSPHNVNNYVYRAIFQELEGQEIRTKDFIQALKTEDTIRLYDKFSHSADFERVMSVFFSKLAGDNDPEMLAKCFVETRESQAAEFQLTRISEELIGKVKKIETIEGEEIKKVLERIKVTNRQEFIILVGGKGAGKSTFVERFFNYVLSSNLKDDCVIVRINLANYKGSESDVIQWLDHTLLEECETTLYNGAPTSDEIQGIFYGEYTRLKRAKKVLYETDKNQFKIEFSNHIEARRETRPTEYIQKLIGNIVKSRRKIPCIIFDNTDHFSIEIQDKVFQYGRSIYENEICLVIVPITDKTSWQLSKQGAIKSYENEVMFLPTPPPRKIIEKRIEYLDQKIISEKKDRGNYFLNRGIQLTLEDIEGLARFLQLIFLQDEQTSKWIGSFSNYDIRTTLELTKDLISSPHISLDEYLKLYVEKDLAAQDKEYSIKPYRIKNALIKRNYYSYPVNHHPFIQNLYYATGNVNTTPLLSVRILQVLMDRKSDRGANDTFLPVNQILDYFNAMRIERSIVNKHLQFLLAKGLINSYDPSITDIDYSKSVEITPSGTTHYYWTLNDLDYIHSMLEVTPITDKHFYNMVDINYYKFTNKLELLTNFLDYLEGEDALYCKVPEHLSYKGQNVINKRFDWQRKIITKKLQVKMTSS